jgi:hypothetical protein
MAYVCRANFPLLNDLDRVSTWRNNVLRYCTDMMFVVEIMYTRKDSTNVVLQIECYEKSSV